jgi:diguanylate cyclase (GGDEF)-like protein
MNWVNRVMNMEMLKSQKIMCLKSRFFDLIDTTDGFIHSDSLIEQMLGAVKDFSEASEVRYQGPGGSVIGTDSSVGGYGQIGHPAGEAELRGAACCRISLSARSMDLGFLELNGLPNPLNEEIIRELSSACAAFIMKARELGGISAREKRYKQLFRVTEQFHSSMDMDAVLGEIIKTLQEVYPEFTYYLMLSHDNNSHGDLPLKDLEYDSQNIAAMQAYVTGAIQFEDSISEKKSVLYAPLKGKQGVYGVLQVIAPNALVFPESEVEFISILANTAGGALENAQLYHQSKRLIADLQLINETSHQLNSNLRLTETMTYMAEQIIKSFDAEEAGFVLLSEESEQVSILKGSTSFFRTRESGIYIKYIKEKIRQDKDSLFIGELDLQNDALIEQFKSVMAVPMSQSGVLKGFALILHRDPYHFSFETFKLLQSLIHHSTLALTNSMLREELEKMVVTDHLTRLYSRNYLDERIHQSLKEDSEGAFILVDIDNFKSVNDTYGHQVGDEVIVQVAGIIMNSIRGTDVAARWGGEELAVYLPSISLETGVAIAERIVRKVSESTNPVVTISCGVSHWNMAREDSYSWLFKRADKALYTAKESGKNQVVVQGFSIL